MSDNTTDTTTVKAEPWRRIVSDLLMFALGAVVATGVYFLWINYGPGPKIYLDKGTFSYALGNFYAPKTKRYWNQSANLAGIKAQLTEEVYYNDGWHPGRYTNSLETLLGYDASINDDPLVTFTFGAVNFTGYTFTTRHAKGSKDGVFMFKDGG
ncbi:MAG: hypothetical protein M5R36_04105 [Deltaproteobacteria bacterium]|nr:hypothetical protein [Deltaproteobacteria bacterium]